MKRSEEILNILNNTSGERSISNFLSRYPEVVRWAVCKSGGHMVYVLKEFPLGSHFKTDFVALMSYSGMWEVHFIELEPHDDIVITKEGIPSNRLNKAISQTKDWKQYIEKNPTSIRGDLADWCMKKDLLGYYSKTTEPSNNTGDRLRSIETYVRFHYHIIIGSRKNVDSKKRNKINQLVDHRTSIFTYGRIIDLSRNLDRSEDNPSENIYLLQPTHLARI